MGYSFKLKNNNNPNKNKMDLSLILMIVFIIMAITCCTISFIMATKHLNSFIDKKYNNKNYIYTIKKEKNKTSEGVYNNIPVINLKGTLFDNVNEEILNNYKEVIKEEKYNYVYKYNQSENILSLAIKYLYYPKNTNNELETLPITYFSTYNIDLKTGKVLTDSELLSKYSINKTELKKYMETKFKTYYEKLISQKYFTKNQCDYNCFLANRGITTNYLKDSNLYIENGSLMLFKFYYKSSYLKDFKEYNFFKDKSYKFLIKK